MTRTQSDIPQRLGKYELRDEIGRGSMGVVYEGYDSFASRPVAIKLANAEALQDETHGRMYQRMFFNEAHAAGMLNHPNILSVYDAGVEGDHLYLVMEYVAGGLNLKQHCRPDKLFAIDKVVELAFKAAKALDYAHRSGVVHRDIKPGNLLLTPDLDLKIGDFSIAYINQADLNVTQPVGLVGSPLYMSPEQVQEDQLSGQTDIFSLGVVMYELLTGEHPFKADKFSRLIRKIVRENPVALRTIRPELPQPLEAIVLRAMAKPLSKRYASGAELAADLSAAFSQLGAAHEEIASHEKLAAVKDLEFFRDFPEADIWQILRSSLWQSFAPNQEILAEGDLDDAFYILVSGQVAVSKGGNLIGRLKRGDCFGEMGYVSKSKRVASIVAANDVQLLKVHASHIDQTSLSCQLNFHKVFLRTLIGRLSVATERLGQQPE